MRTELAVPDLGFVSVGVFFFSSSSNQVNDVSPYFSSQANARRRAAAQLGIGRRFPALGLVVPQIAIRLPSTTAENPLKFDVVHSQQTARIPNPIPGGKVGQHQDPDPTRVTWAAPGSNGRFSSTARSALAGCFLHAIDKNRQKHTPETDNDRQGFRCSREGAQRVNQEKKIPRADATAPTAGCAIVARCCIGLCHRAAVGSTEQH